MLSSYFNPTLVLKLRERGYFVGEFFYTLSFSSKRALTDFIETITQSQRLKEENKLLRVQIEKLLFKEKNYYPELEATNRRLRELLEFKKHTSYKLIPVELLAHSPEDFFKVIYLNKGRKDKVREGMGVINARGLVGKVVEVYSHQSKVLLILDKRSKVGVRDQRTRDIGILQGTGSPDRCRLDYILNKAEVKIGDRVITSGLGGLFPPGILVGYISAVERKPNYIFQKIEVEPAVDFGKLEELFLIVKEE
jgi:rod shape-determining protein MreC